MSFSGVVLNLGREGHSIMFWEFRAGKVLILPCLYLFGWPGRFALWDRRVETAMSYCPWNFCLMAKHRGISVYTGHHTLLTRLPFCKSSAAAFYKIPEVVVNWASPVLEIGKGCFHYPCLKPPLLIFPPYLEFLWLPRFPGMHCPPTFYSLQRWTLGTDCKIRIARVRFWET